MSDYLIYYIKAGGIYFVFFVVLLLTYFILKTLIISKRYIMGDSQVVKKEIRLHLNVFTFVVGWLVFYAGALGWLFWHINVTATVEKINYYSDLFMLADKKIFGLYPALSMQGLAGKHFFDWLSLPIIKVYDNLALALGIVFVGCLIKDSRLFYQMALSITLAVIISAPLWYLFPAVSPLEAYVLNLGNFSLPDGVASAVQEYNPNVYVAQFISRFENDNKEWPYFSGVTTLPSMHVAWAAIILFFGIKITPLLVWLLLPYFVLNTAGTLLTAQHYAIDLIFGVAAAAAAIQIAVKNFKTAPEPLALLSGEIKKDIKTFSELFSK